MYCGHCGAYVADDLNFCENCGKPMIKAVPVQMPAAQVQMPVTAPVQKKKAPVWLFILLGVVVLGCAALGTVLLFAGGGDYTYTFSDPARYFVENDVYGAALYPAWQKEYDGFLIAGYNTNFDDAAAANFAMEHHIVPFYEGQGFKLVKTLAEGNQITYFFRYGGRDADILPRDAGVEYRSHLTFTVNDEEDGTIFLGMAWTADLFMEPFEAPMQVKDESEALFSFYSPVHYDDEDVFIHLESYDETGRHVSVYQMNCASDDAYGYVEEYWMTLAMTDAFAFDNSTQKETGHRAILLSYEDPSVTPMTYYDEASMYTQTECALALVLARDGDIITLTVTYCDSLAMEG